MEAQILRPQRSKIEVKGKLSYLESTHSWSLINLKKVIIDEFPQLKERISSFYYKMVFYHEYEELEKLVKKLKRDKEALPIMMWLVKEKTN